MNFPEEEGRKYEMTAKCIALKKCLLQVELVH